MRDRETTRYRVGLAASCLLVAACVFGLRDLLTAKDRFIGNFWLFAALYATAFAASIAAAAIARRLSAAPIVCAIVLGIVLRFSLVAQTPVLSDDIYRYYWDGKVAANGINPFIYPPEHERLDSLRDAPGRLVNHPYIRTLYPPAAQMFFRVCYAVRPGIVGIKVALVLVDAVLVAALWLLLRVLGRPPGLVLVYGLSPLAILEVGHSGHIDPLGSLFLVLTLLAAMTGRWLLAGLACGVSGAAKIIGGVAGVFFLGRRRLKAAALALGVFLVVYVPYAGAGRRVLSGLGIYAEKMYFNTPFFAIAEAGVGRNLTLVVSAFAVMVVLAHQLWMNRPLPHAVRMGVGALLVFGPVLYPWYCIWVLPLAIATASPAWIVYTGVVVLSYLANVRDAHGGIWGVPCWAMAIEYGLLFGIGIWWHIKSAKVRGDG